MSTNIMLPQLLFRNQRSLLVSGRRHVRGPFGKPKRDPDERNRVTLAMHLDKHLKLAPPLRGRPVQFKPHERPKDPIVKTKERKLPSLAAAGSPYQQFTERQIKGTQDQGTYFDPLFNPHLHEGRNRVDPNEEPFNAIYADSQSESRNDYTNVRNITTPELWKYVERLARIRLPPKPMLRKADEPVTSMPSGFVPPPETPPDLPYFISRTRNYLLPVYYKLDSDPEKCFTIVKLVTGDLWQLEEDLRTHLESLNQSKRRILTSVQETDERILFRGRYVHEVVDWLHKQGF